MPANSSAHEKGVNIRTDNGPDGIRHFSTIPTPLQSPVERWLHLCWRMRTDPDDGEQGGGGRGEGGEQLMEGRGQG